MRGMLGCWPWGPVVREGKQAGGGAWASGPRVVSQCPEGSGAPGRGRGWCCYGMWSDVEGSDFWLWFGRTPAAGGQAETLSTDGHRDGLGQPKLGLSYSLSSALVSGSLIEPSRRRGGAGRDGTRHFYHVLNLSVPQFPHL